MTDDNHERAYRVEPFVRAYRDAYDYGEPLATVMTDIITDILHLLDQLEGGDRDELVTDHIDLLARAQTHYEYEKEEE